jgi:cytochrome c oxidase subunit 2
MDAVPGLPTYFVFTPTKTTKEWRRGLSEYAEYQEIDEASEEGLERWQTANMELACAELCGKGHYSMARNVIILEQDQFDTWYAGQTSFYEANIKGTEDDPLFMAELKERREAFMTAADNALATPSEEDNTLNLEYVEFETGSADLTDASAYQLDDAITYLEEHENVNVMLMGHTDDSGDASENLTLSNDRARAVRDYLVSNGISADRLDYRGYGSERPVADNATEEGKTRNRRTELYITESELAEPSPADASK